MLGRHIFLLWAGSIKYIFYRPFQIDIRKIRSVAKQEHGAHNIIPTWEVYII